MNRTPLILLAPLLYLFMTGCGGGDENPIAPPVNLMGDEHPDDKMSRMDLEKKVARAKDACADFGATMVHAVAPQIYQQPGMPIPMMMGPMGPLAAQMPMISQKKQRCSDALMMAVMNCRTMKNGQYCQRPDVQKWLFGNLAGVGNRVMGTLPMEAMANGGFRQAIQGAGIQIAIDFARDLNIPEANQYISQYAGMY